jgi:hypothetical protein
MPFFIVTAVKTSNLITKMYAFNTQRVIKRNLTGKPETHMTLTFKYTLKCVNYSSSSADLLNKVLYKHHLKITIEMPGIPFI